MSKYTYLIDYGHGGLINNIYQTKGKMSPKFDDGTFLYEGVQNRRIGRTVMEELKKLKINFYDVVDSDKDISLATRVKTANAYHARLKNCIYISIHANAGPVYAWHSASGISVHTSDGTTKSDKVASIIFKHLKDQFKDTVKWRTDNTDGDPDIENDFFVLRVTNCPAVLLELGFMTNKEEAKRMLTDEWINKCVTAIINAIKEIENGIL